jgi:hypothetical protein
MAVPTWTCSLHASFIHHDEARNVRKSRFQERAYYEQVCAVDDDFVPYLVPWFGTVVLASAFGSRVEFPPGLDPAADPRFYPVHTSQDIRRLAIPDPEKDGFGGSATPSCSGGYTSGYVIKGNTY